MYIVQVCFTVVCATPEHVCSTVDCAATIQYMSVLEHTLLYLEVSLLQQTVLLLYSVHVRFAADFAASGRICSMK